jgi:hypothetical protein
VLERLDSCVTSLRRLLEVIARVNQFELTQHRRFYGRLHLPLAVVAVTVKLLVRHYLSIEAVGRL